MIKVGKDHNLVPKWLTVNRPMVPDFVARDPKAQPVWEITGAEFTNQGVHTADSISIRFPRVTKIRDDKCWKTATSLKELRALFDKSSMSMDFSLLLATKGAGDTKQTKLDTYLKPSTSCIEKSPSGSPVKKLKEEASSDEEKDKIEGGSNIVSSRVKREIKQIKNERHCESSLSEGSDEDNGMEKSSTGLAESTAVSLY